MSNQKIYGANIVLPDRVLFDGTVVIAENRIEQVYEGRPTRTDSSDIDVNGAWVLPGMIDTHSDAIEVEVEPRPGSLFPLEMSFYELEKKLVSEGVTTIYHAVALMDEQAKSWIRSLNHALETIEKIKQLAEGTHLIRHRTHLRYEIANTTAAAHVKQLIEARQIDQLSFMDHSPGQGQYRDIEQHKTFLREHRHFSEEEISEVIERGKTQEKLNPFVLQDIAAAAAKQGIPLASHDDDSFEKLEDVASWNAQISEFPITLEVAKRAKEKGMYVVAGAPNVMLGKSHNNNLSAMEAIKEGAVDILCSDYSPPSMLHSVFKLFHHGISMEEAVRMVTLNPAKALGIASELGSIEAGKLADLLIVGEEQKRPFLQSVFVNGREACRMNYQIRNTVPSQ